MASLGSLGGLAHSRSGPAAGAFISERLSGAVGE